MLFSDPLFAPFLIVVFLLWLPLGRNGRKALLVLASLFFYACWDIRFLLALCAVWIVLFMVPLIWEGRRAPARRGWLIGGISALLFLLFYFKYLNFFLSSTKPLWRGVLSQGSMGSLKIILPIGISFYTLQAISYLVDAYRGKMSASRSPLDVALYVSFFPLLFAGPIEKGMRWLPQLQGFHPFRMANLRDGFERMLLGYLLKIGVADPLAPLCADVLARSTSAGSGELWAGALGYSLQIFSDFAGYSLIARGVSKVFGYEVINNFEQPYFSRSFSEFWRRWHISLSTWIWEYVFNPLMSFSIRCVGRIKKMAPQAEVKAAYPCAVLVTMLLCGLWHGAGWTFVVWGALHGLFLTFERLVVFKGRAISKYRRSKGFRSLARALASAAVVFMLITVLWVVFRAGSIHGATTYLHRMVFAGGWLVQQKFLAILAISMATVGFLELLQYRRRNEWVFRSAGSWRGLAYAAALAYIVVFGSPGGKIPFIYFQF